LKFLVATATIAVELSEGSYTTNLNYRSPSELHPAMGVSIHKVVKRNNPQTRQIDAANVSVLANWKRRSQTEALLAQLHSWRCFGRYV